MESSVTFASLESQKNEITQLMQTSISVESVWYLIDVRWLKLWKKYVGYDEWESGMIGEETSNPGPIDNSNLLDDDYVTLKENLSDEIEYTLLPKPAWDKLVSWYGLQQGQEPLERRVIEQGVFVKHRKVEVYFLQLKLCLFADVTQVKTRHFSHATTIAELKEEIKTIFNIPADREIRLWNNYLNNTYECLARLKDEDTLQDAGFYSGNTVVAETKKEDGSWQREDNNTKSVMNSLSSSASGGTSYSTKSVSNTYGLNSAANANSLALSNATSNRLYTSSAYSNTSYYDSYRSTAGPGLCGLGNLGNTCFMNSAIQCLSNVPALTEYMVNDCWKEELNVDNPLGMHGEVAMSYAELIKILWCGKYSYTIPRNFKISVGRFKPEFSGYQQQDSQELMAFLLDGLHEDLNRIKKKPYVETKEANNRPDREVAEESWSDYIKRNDSVIVDIFHGLLKSTLVCPECRKVSVKFDPFCYLSLPLPVKKERQIEVILVPWDPMRKLRQFKLTVQKMGVVSHLCSALSQLTRVSPEKMLVVDVYNHRFHKIFSPNESLTQIMDRDDIFAYELPPDITDDKELKLIPIYFRLDRTRLFGLPTLIAIKYKGCTYDYLYNSILDRMARYIRRPESHCRRRRVKAQADCDDDMDHQSADDEVSDEDGNSQSNDDKKSESSEDGEEENGDEDVSDCDDQRVCRLFSLSFVNIYGNTEVSRLSDDGGQIKFGGAYPYLAADWQSSIKDRFYDEKSAEELEIDESMNNKPMPKKQSIQLSECLELFTTTELLGEHDLWYCPVCKRHEQATKKFDIWQLPRILVIHLKRFSYTRYWRDKLDTSVDFPIYGLDMSHWVINPNHGPAVYDLLAVSNHYGGMGGGHYTAFAKNKNDNRWYHFDDSSVSATSEDSVVTKAGYVLVYERRDAAVTARRSKRTTASAAAGKAESANCDEDNVENEMDIN